MAFPADCPHAFQIFTAMQIQFSISKGILACLRHISTNPLDNPHIVNNVKTNLVTSLSCLQNKKAML